MQVTCDGYAFDEVEFRRLIACAATLNERLSGKIVPPCVQDEAVISDLLQRWKERAAFGDCRRFANRLAWNGYNEEYARKILSDGGSWIGPLPSWAITIREILIQAHIHSDITHDFFSNESVLPFEEVFYDFVHYALRQLRSQGKGQGRHCLARSLIRRLTSIASEALQMVFEEARPTGHTLLAHFSEELGLKPSHELYGQFVGDLRHGGFELLLRRFPVLARLLGTSIGLWVDETNEFYERLQADSAELESIFNDGQPLGDLIQIESELSDPHKGGHVVRILEFSSGVKIVYKPRSLGLEVAWNEFLKWLNKHLDETPLWTPKAIDRQAYGWVEYVGQFSCVAVEAIRRFYVRAGSLVCLTYVLQGSDFHHENVFSCGEFPVLIDLETLFTPEIQLGRRMQAMLDTYRQVFRSVLTSGLLPQWETVEQGDSFDMSGLGSAGKDESSGEELTWKQVNTDEMHQAVQRFAGPDRCNAPLLRGVPARAEDYVEDIISGFETTYRVLMTRSDEILAANGPLELFRGHPVRVLYRDTDVYMTLLQQAHAPEHLSSGIRCSIELELLARTFHTDLNPVDLWRVLQSEVLAMEQLDIPHFVVMTDSQHLTPPASQTIRNFFRRSGLDAARLTIAQLSNADLAKQMTFIRASFFAKLAQEDVTEGSCDKLPTPQLTLDRSSLLDRACEIGSTIISQAVGESCSLATWIDIQYLPSYERYQLQLLGPGLYGGVVGIAIFLSGLYSLTGDATSRDVSVAALATSRLPLSEDTSNSGWARISAREMGIGVGEGVASLVYGHVVAGRLLNDRSLLDHAVRLSRFIASEDIASDSALDVLAGCGGALLALCALWEETGDHEVLRRAIECGNRLVSAQISGGPSLGGWLHGHRQALTGFSHGAAGNAYALLRLHAATQESSFQKAAISALNYERRQFSPYHNNWPDYRSGAAAWAFGWCNGAPGIGLGRIGARRFGADPVFSSEIDAALCVVRNRQHPSVDHVCCGRGGHIELLLKSGLSDEAYRHASEWIGAAEVNGGFRLFDKLPRKAQSLGFFQGLSGIGYQMLRLAAPAQIPSILLFE